MQTAPAALQNATRHHALELLVAITYFSLFCYSLARGEPLHILHWDDEPNYHLPLIRAYAEHGAGYAAEHYTSATPPLFHIVFASLHVLSGGNVWFLRAFNLLLTALIPLVAYRCLRARLSEPEAFCLSLPIAFAPYIWTRGFVLLTESLATLLALLSIAPFALRTRPTLRDTVVSSTFLALAVATRQQWFFLAVALPLALLSSSTAPLRQRLQLVSPFVLPAIVLGVIAIAWGGLVPENFRAVNASVDPNFRAIAFTWAILGVCAAGVAPGSTWGTLTARPKVFALCFVAAAVLAWAVGMRFQSHQSDNGFLWRMSTVVPDVAGANPFLAALMAVGIFYWLEFIRRGGIGLALIIPVFALSFWPVRQNFQKYYEPAILLWVCATASMKSLSWVDRCGQILFATAGGLYALLKLG